MRLPRRMRMADDGCPVRQMRMRSPLRGAMSFSSTSWVVWAEDVPAREKEAQLDGCYVVQSDLPVATATAQAVHDRYLDLTQVERDFRTLKTGLLEIRPVFLRKADRTRGHALVSLLALKLARALDRRV